MNKLNTLLISFTIIWIGISFWTFNLGRKSYSNREFESGYLAGQTYQNSLWLYALDYCIPEKQQKYQIMYGSRFLEEECSTTKLILSK